MVNKRKISGGDIVETRLKSNQNKDALVYQEEEAI